MKLGFALPSGMPQLPVASTTVSQTALLEAALPSPSSSDSSTDSSEDLRPSSVDASSLRLMMDQVDGQGIRHAS
eukprot:4046836-Amphidinium_carterae.3